MRALRVLSLAVVLGGCAWWGGSDEEPAAEEEKSGAAEVPEGASSAGPCTRKGRRWAEGSRVCEDHKVTRCFSDGVWRVIGSC